MIFDLIEISVSGLSLERTLFSFFFFSFFFFCRFVSKDCLRPDLLFLIDGGRDARGGRGRGRRI